MKKILSLFVLLVAIVTGASAQTEVTLVEWSSSTGAWTTGADDVTKSSSNVTVPGSVKINTNTNTVKTIQFGSSFKVTEGVPENYILIAPEGGFKAGDVITIAGAFNNNDETKQAAVGIYYDNGDDTFPQLFQTADFINGKTQAADPTAEQFTLTSNVNGLYFGRFGNTATHITTLKITRVDSRQESDLAVDPAETSVNMNETTDVTYTTSSTGAVSVESSDPDVATATLDATNKTITISGLTAGTTTITVSQEADDSYVAGSATINVEVIDPSAPVVIANWDSKGTFTYTGTEKSTVKINTNTTTVDAIKLGSTTTETGGVYDKVVEVTVDGGFKKGDVVTVAGCYNNSAEKTAYIGISTDTEGKEVAISDALINGRLVNDAPTELVYTLQQDASVIYVGRATGSGTTAYATKILVERAPSATENITIPAEGVATYVTTNALDFSTQNGAFTAYTVTDIKTKSVATAEVTQVPAGTPLLLKGAAGSYDVEVIESAQPVENLLKAADGIVAGDGSTIFAYSNKKFKFTKVAEGLVIPAGKAYLQITTPNAPTALDVDFDGATAINNVNANDNANSAAPVKVVKNGKLYIGNYNVAGQLVK